MRIIVPALVVMALIGLSLATRYSDDSGQVAEVRGQDVAPVPILQEASLPVRVQEEAQTTIREESRSDTTNLNVVRELPLPAAEIEFAPEMREKIADSLSANGLAPTDGERIADSALIGIGECIELALGNSDSDSTSNQAETCMFNVLADYGLNEVPLNEVNLSIVSLP